MSHHQASFNRICSLALIDCLLSYALVLTLTIALLLAFLLQMPFAELTNAAEFVNGPAKKASTSPNVGLKHLLKDRSPVVSPTERKAASIHRQRQLPKSVVASSALTPTQQLAQHRELNGKLLLRNKGLEERKGLLLTCNLSCKVTSLN